MALYAIGDLHFSPHDCKPMDTFGWIDYKRKILQSWEENVKEDDVVILAGDISWALKYSDAKYNLDEIDVLSGKKIILKGNHDYWWQSVSKMSRDYPGIFFLHNNCYQDDRYIVFGTRGWDAPNTDYTQEDEKIYQREVGRLKLSLSFEKEDGIKRLRIVAMHYPPVNEKHQDSEITKVIRENDVQHMLYGHLHGKEAFRYVYEGEKNKTVYHLVSADYLDFNLKKIAD